MTLTNEQKTKIEETARELLEGIDKALPKTQIFLAIDAFLTGDGSIVPDNPSLLRLQAWLSKPQLILNEALALPMGQDKKMAAEAKKIVEEKLISYLNNSRSDLKVEVSTLLATNASLSAQVQALTTANAVLQKKYDKALGSHSDKNFLMNSLAQKSSHLQTMTEERDRLKLQLDEQTQITKNYEQKYYELFTQFQELVKTQEAQANYRPANNSNNNNLPPSVFSHGYPHMSSQHPIFTQPPGQTASRKRQCTVSNPNGGSFPGQTASQAPQFVFQGNPYHPPQETLLIKAKIELKTAFDQWISITKDYETGHATLQNYVKELFNTIKSANDMLHLLDLKTFCELVRGILSKVSPENITFLKANFTPQAELLLAPLQLSKLKSVLELAQNTLNDELNWRPTSSM